MWYTVYILIGTGYLYYITNLLNDEKNKDDEIVREFWSLYAQFSVEVSALLIIMCVLLWLPAIIFGIIFGRSYDNFTGD